MYSNRTGCTNSCPATQALNLEGTLCITNSPGCGANTIDLTWASSNLSCQCKATHIKSPDKTTCIDSCPASYAMNLANTSCVDCTTGCGSLTATLSCGPAGLSCACQSGKYIKADLTQCVSECPSGSALNLLKTMCVLQSPGCGPNAGSPSWTTAGQSC